MTEDSRGVVHVLLYQTTHNHARIESDRVGARTEHRFDCDALLVPVKLRDLAPNNVARPSCAAEQAGA